MFENRSKNFQKSFSAEQEKAEREDFAVALRKSKRIEYQKKRRDIGHLTLDQESKPDDRLDVFCSSLAAVNSNAEIIALLKSAKEMIVNNSNNLKSLSKAGFSEPLCSLLCSESDEIVEITTWIISNWSSIDNETFSELYKNNCFENLIALLTHHSESIIENSLWSISNFIAHSEEYYSALIELDLLQRIKKHSKNLRFHVVITWLLKNISIKKGTLIENYAESIVMLCVNIVQTRGALNLDYEIILILSNICQSSEDAVELMFHTGLVGRSFDVCIEQPLAVLMLLGNIIVVAERFADMFLKKGLMDLLSALFHSKDDAIVCKVYWVLSNLIACGSPLIWNVVQHSLFKAAVDGFDKHSRLTLMKSLVFLRNLLEIDSSSIMSVVDQSQVLERLIVVATGNANEIINDVFGIFRLYVQSIDGTHSAIPLISHFALEHTSSPDKTIKRLAYKIVYFLGEFRK